MHPVAAIVQKLRRGDTLSPDEIDAVCDAAWRPTKSDNRGERNNLIREYRLRIYPSLKKTAAARRVSEALERYLSTSWHRDKDKHSLSAKLAGTERDYLFRIVKSGPPVTYFQLRNIIDQ